MGRRSQQGAAAVEFALVSTLFLTLLVSVLGFGHWIHTLELLSDAMRAAARVASVCDINASAVKREIQSRVPQLGLDNSQIVLSYLPEGCSISTCQALSISITGATYTSWIPALAAALPVPPFTTTLPRESLQSAGASGEPNPVCL